MGLAQRIKGGLTLVLLLSFTFLMLMGRKLASDGVASGNHLDWHRGLGPLVFILWGDPTVQKVDVIRMNSRVSGERVIVLVEEKCGGWRRLFEEAPRRGRGRVEVICVDGTGTGPNDFSRGEGLKGIYQHFSRNNIPLERRCMERAMLLQQLCQRRGLEALTFMDADILLLAPLAALGLRGDADFEAGDPRSAQTLFFIMIV